MDCSTPARRVALGQLLAGGAVVVCPTLAFAAENDDATYDKNTISHDVTAFFGSTTEGLAKVASDHFAVMVKVKAD